MTAILGTVLERDGSAYRVGMDDTEVRAVLRGKVKLDTPKVVVGDVVRLDASQGTLSALVSDAEWNARQVEKMPESLKESDAHGLGRELFAGMRRNALAAEEGACTWL